MSQSTQSHEPNAEEVALALPDPFGCFDEARAREILALLDYAPAFPFQPRGQLDGKGGTVRPTIRAFTDTMDAGGDEPFSRWSFGTRLYFQPCGRMVTPGPYLVYFPKGDSLDLCRLLPSPAGDLRVAYDNPAYEGFAVPKADRAALRPLALLTGRVGHIVTTRVNAARKRGQIPTWR